MPDEFRQLRPFPRPLPVLLLLPKPKLYIVDPLSSAFLLPMMAQTAIEKATVRQVRDDDRPMEDDVAKAKLGPQGVPVKPDNKLS